MAKLEEISVKGIRSYSFDSVSTIKFEENLNIIHGKNGTGKTTILECLRLIFTGNFPSGTKLSTFLNDTKTSKIQQMKASIELGFKDKKMSQYKALKSFQMNYKDNKIETKTLESRLEKFDYNKKKINISSRGSDFVNEIIMLTGIPTSIMDYVIFCHHDDSTWPISDSKTLKDRLDSIFSTTLYNKALESIRSIRKSKTQSVNEMQPAIKKLKEINEKAHELSNRVSSLMLEIDLRTKNRIKLCDKESSINVDIAELMIKKEKIDKINYLSNRISIINDNLLKEVSEIKIPKSINNYKNINIESEIQKSTNTLEIFNSELEEINKSHNYFLEKNQELAKKINRKSSKFENYKFNKENLYKSINMNKILKNKIYEKHSEEEIYKIINDNIDEINVNNEKEMKILENDIKSTSEKLENSKYLVESKNIKVGNILHSIEIKNSSISQISAKLHSVQSKIDKINYESQEIKIIEMEISKNSQNLLNLEKIDLVTMQENIKNLEDSIMSYEKDLSILQVNIDNLINLMSYSRNNESKISLISEKNENFKDIINKNKDIISQIYYYSDDRNLEYLAELSSKIITHLSQIEKQISDKNYDIAASENEKSTNSELLKNKRRRIESLKQKISQLNEKDITTVDNELKEIDKKVGKSNKRIIKNRTLLKFNQNYIKNLILKNKCLICEENVSNQDNIVQKVSLKNEKYNIKIKKYRKIFSMIVKIRNKKIKNIENNETIKITKTEINQIIIDINNIIERNKLLIMEISSSKTELASLNNEKIKYNDTLICLKLCEKYTQEIAELQKNIDTTIESSKDIYLKITNKKEEMIKIKDKIEKNGAEIQNFQNQINLINKSKFDISNKMFTLQKKISNVHSDKKYIADLIKEKSENISLINEIKTEINSLNRTLEDERSNLITLKNNVDEVSRTLEMLQSSKYDISLTFQQTYNELVKLIEEIKIFKSKNIQHKIEKYSQKILNLNAEQDNYRNKINSESIRKNEIQRKKKEIENLIQDLNIYLNYIQKKSLIDENILKIEKYEIQINSISNNSNVEKQIELLNNEVLKIKYEMKMIDGSLYELERQIKDLKNDLLHPPFYDSNRNFLKKLTELHVTSMIINDMDQYYAAFDFAISKYHHDKIEEINRIIKSFWEISYKSDDIHTIKISAEVDDTGGLKQRRSYNYKVLMVKDGIETDMRGKCSSGQKMIACIIIRIALFKAFCSNCSFIALDEPTTNLDEENLKGLAESLTKLTSHENFSNFQLIVITHDEKFLRFLCHDQDIRNYFEICKDKNGFSVISKKGISQIFSLS